MGRATKMIEGENVTLYTYTPTGRLKSVVDGLGNEARYTYDSFDNLQSVCRCDGMEDEYKRVKFPNVDKKGHITFFEYDLSGQLISMTDALGEQEKFEYDQYGRLKTKIDKDGYRTAYSYNGHDQVKSIEYADGKSVEFSYDAIGNLVKFKDWLGETLLKTDPLGRVTKVQDYDGRIIEYGYTPTGERDHMVYPNGEIVRYEYDEKMRISRVTAGENIITYGYDHYNRLDTKKFSNGASTKYDSFGNRTQLEEKERKVTYSYDNLDRLLKSTEIINGNVENDTEYLYDKRGNINKVFHNGELTKQFVYDSTNMLAQVDNISLGITEYTYNGLGFRRKVASPDKQIRYLYDMTRAIHNLLECRTEEELENYVYDNNVIGLSHNHEMIYYMSDEMGSPNWLTGTEGTALKSYAYDEFGLINEKYSKNLNYAKQGNIIQPFAFTGYQNDEESGLYYAHARYYNANVGRFVSSDKIDGILANPETQNRYVYCFSNPIMYTDCSGYWCGIDDLIAVGVGAVGGVAGQFVSDLVTSATTHKWQFSGVEDYVGAAAGGAVGGLVTLYAGPIAGAAADGVVSSLAADGLRCVNGTNTKSAKEILWDASINGAAGAATCGVLDGIGKGAKKVAGKIVEKTHIKTPGIELKGLDDIGNEARTLLKNARQEADDILKPLKSRRMPKVREKLLRKAANVKKKAFDGIYEYTRKNFGKIFAGELLGSARDNFVTSFSIKGHSIKSLLEFKFASADVMDITVQEECC